jgi:hypothetical protein
VFVLGIIIGGGGGALSVLKDCTSGVFDVSSPYTLVFMIRIGGNSRYMNAYTTKRRAGIVKNRPAAIKIDVAVFITILLKT